MSSYDYLSTVVWCRTIYLWFSFPPGNHSQVVCHRTIIARLSYDVIRYHRHSRTWPKTAMASWDWPPDDCDVIQRRATSHDLPPMVRDHHKMSLIYIVRCCCTTSCDIVRPSKIILRYPTLLGIAAYSTMLGIAARFLNITKTPKTSRDDPWWLRRRATLHDYTQFIPDGPRSPKFTHRKSSHGVVKAGVTVA